jgi:hypothetical protein
MRSEEDHTLPGIFVAIIEDEKQIDFNINLTFKVAVFTAMN